MTDVDENQRVSIAHVEQLQEWAARLGTSAEHLRELVAQVGPRIRDLRARLASPQD